jgi:hypothetical protein
VTNNTIVVYKVPCKLERVTSRFMRMIGQSAKTDVWGVSLLAGIEASTPENNTV